MTATQLHDYTPIGQAKTTRKARTRGFTRTPNQLIDAKLPDSAKMLWIYLSSHDQSFNETTDQIAKGLGWGRKKVLSAKKILLKHKMISVDKWEFGNAEVHKLVPTIPSVWDLPKEGPASPKKGPGASPKKGPGPVPKKDPLKEKLKENKNNNKPTPAPEEEKGVPTRLEQNDLYNKLKQEKAQREAKEQESARATAELEKTLRDDSSPSEEPMRIHEWRKFIPLFTNGKDEYFDFKEIERLARYAYNQGKMRKFYDFLAKKDRTVAFVAKDHDIPMPKVISSLQGKIDKL